MGTAVCLAWAGTAARDASVYIADAPVEALPLIGGDHDWAFLLAPHLDWAEPLATATRFAGLVAFVGGTVLAGVLVSRRAATARPVPAPVHWTDA